ncbi:hypothetical protein ACFC0X_19785 [Paenibacillus chitinolyticus]|uniref:hypothetical protein n=1 Tax=Paenibacillus chitinolyticus TaxID=79263 RepID=UPI0035DBCC0B
MIKKVLLGASFLLLFAGCAGQTKEQEEKPVAATTAPNAETKPSTAAEQQEAKPKEVEVPEPYSIALKKIEAGDLDTALTYLDFTINDFKDSPYLYNAQLLKSILYSSKIFGSSQLIDSLVTGSGKGTALYQKEDRAKLKDLLKKHSKDVEEYQKSSIPPTQYIWDNFSAEKNAIIFKDIKLPKVPAVSDLNFFTSVGYPVPKDDEIAAFLNYFSLNHAASVLEVIVKEEKIVYPNYFYYIGALLYSENNDLSRKFLEKTVELTEDDKYNEVRIKAQKDIKKITNS